MAEKCGARTESGELRNSRRIPTSAPKEPLIEPEWRKSVGLKRGEELLKNMAVAAALVVCAVVLRSGGTATNVTDAVMTAVSTDMTLDDTLGKLTFVSKLFPETALVFGEGGDASLAAPVENGTVVHAWSEAEPYLAYETSDVDVYSACGGEVMGVWHGEGEELLVEVRDAAGVTCCYGNLAQADVTVGDTVLTGSRIGQVAEGDSLFFEVRSNGYSIDPAPLVRGAE